MKRGAADAERVVDVLVRAGAEAVERDRETFYTKLGHGVSRGCGWLRKMACYACRRRSADAEGGRTQRPVNPLTPVLHARPQDDALRFE